MIRNENNYKMKIKLNLILFVPILFFLIGCSESQQNSESSLPEHLVRIKERASESERDNPVFVCGSCGHKQERNFLIYLPQL